MDYQDIQATQVVDLSHEADLGDFSAGKPAIAKLSARRSREWMRHVLTPLEKAVRRLQPGEEDRPGTAKIAQSSFGSRQLV